jgi:hypothetical protein
VSSASVPLAASPDKFREEGEQVKKDSLKTKIIVEL